MSTFKKSVILSTPLFWSISLWVGHFYLIGSTKSTFLIWLLTSYCLVIPGYILIRSLKRPILNHKIGLCFFGVLTILTPSFLQTDQLRYVWDGLQVSQSVNPYRLSPLEASAKMPKTPIWVSQINHPELNTVYPPVAQIVFGLSTFANPFLFEERFKKFISFAERLPKSLYWPWELGWRLMVSISTMMLIFILKDRRWDLVVFHPLYLLTVVANVHIDGILLAPLALILATWSLISPTKAGLSLAVGTLLRWTPMVLLPQIWLRQIRSQGIQFVLLSTVLYLSCIALSLGFFSAGSGGNIFSSAKIYAEHWSFFGYVHRFISDVFRFFQLTKDPIQTAKMIGFSIYGIVAVTLAHYQWKKKLGFRLAATLNYLGFLTVLPTLHPWYLLPLLVIGLPYMKQLNTVWLWPLLAPLSYNFYFQMRDPFWTRLLVYSAVSVFLLLDLRQILRLAHNQRRKLSHEGNYSALPNLQ